MRDVDLPDIDAAAFAAKYGPWAVIAGASDGTGADFAEQLAEMGLNLLLAARRGDLLDELAGRLRAEHGVETRTLVVDLMRPDAADRMLEASADLDVGLYVSNAGVGDQGVPFIDADLDAAKRVIALNVETLTAALHGFGRRLRDRGRGGIVVMSSSAALGGRPYFAMYSATKGYGLLLAESLWAELRPEGVDVVAVVSQAMTTPTMLRGRAGQTIPDGYAYRPADVARAGLASLGVSPLFVFGDQAGKDVPEQILDDRLRRLRMGEEWVERYREAQARAAGEAAGV